MGRIPVIFSANIAGFESASSSWRNYGQFWSNRKFSLAELLGEMINCRAARVGPSQRVETRPRAARSCAAPQHFFLLGLPQLKSEADSWGGRAGVHKQRSGGDHQFWGRRQLCVAVCHVASSRPETTGVPKPHTAGRTSESAARYQ